MSGASSGNQTSSDDDGNDEFPIAAIVCLGVGAYVILIIGIIILKQYCTSRGSCKCCNTDTEEGNRCSGNCCARANEACPCCCKCNLDGCLSKMCGKPKKINCIDVLLCNCGGCTERSCNPFKCCGSCPTDIQCNCCTQQSMCTDCFGSDDDPEPGTCGCLCLEVKLRSPRGGSSRRSTSAPPVFPQERFRQFNTHSGPGKTSIISNGKFPPVVGRRKHFGDGDDGDSDLTPDSVIGHRASKSHHSNNNNNIRLRSSSHSPKLSSTMRLKQMSSSPVKDLSVRTPRNSVQGRGNVVNKSQQKETEERGVYEKSRRNTTDSNNSNNSVTITHMSSNRRKSSKLRKSIRSGQRSQRFPNQTLVTSESLNASSTSAQFETLKSQNRSLPEPFSGVRRPLPAISKANKTQ